MTRSSARAPLTAASLVGLVVVLALAPGCVVCEEAANSLSADDYQGLRGTLYARGTTCLAECTHREPGMVRAFDRQTEALVDEDETDLRGDFVFPLPIGRYRVTAVVDGAEAYVIDDLEIGADGGYQLVHVFEHTYQPGVLALRFRVGVDAAGVDTFLERHGLERLPARAQVDGEVRIRPVLGQLVWDLRGSLLADDDLADATLNYLVCDANDDGAWPTTDGSSGGGGGDWD